jgi:hypothetical protein
MFYIMKIKKFAGGSIGSGARHIERFARRASAEEALLAFDAGIGIGAWPEKAMSLEQIHNMPAAERGAEVVKYEEEPVGNGECHQTWVCLVMI